MNTVLFAFNETNPPHWNLCGNFCKLNPIVALDFAIFPGRSKQFPLVLSMDKGLKIFPGLDPKIGSFRKSSSSRKKKKFHRSLNSVTPQNKKKKILYAFYDDNLPLSTLARFTSLFLFAFKTCYRVILRMSNEGSLKSLPMKKIKFNLADGGYQFLGMKFKANSYYQDIVI